MASFIVYGDASGQVTVAAPAVAGSNTITFPAETGTLVTSASTISALPGQIAWDTTVKTSGFTAVAYGGYFCNTTSSAFTVTLPATPTRGQFVVIVDYAGTAGTNNIGIGNNGSNINGVASGIAIATNRAGLTLTYIDSTQGWVASSNVYGSGAIYYQASYLSVAGGGGGGVNWGGGGGAGGYLTGTINLAKGTVYTATVGSGGGSAAAGNNSSISGSGLTTITSIGGGYGGQYAGNSGSSGGSGGGAGGNVALTLAGGSGTPGQGNNGGGSAPYNASGGGGSGSVGANGSPSAAGNGGSSTSSSITGSSVAYAGGGGAGANFGTTAGTGGGGGAANGGSATSPSAGNAGGNATANTGGGGGGGAANSPSGGSGGSGVVVLSVPTANYTGTVTGSPTVTTSGSNTIIKWTSGSGTYTA